MKSKIILVFIGFLIFQGTIQNSFLNGSLLITDICEETSDEGNNIEDLNDIYKITNNFINIDGSEFLIYIPSCPLHFQIKTISATYQIVDTPPPNVKYISSPVIFS